MQLKKVGHLKLIHFSKNKKKKKGLKEGTEQKTFKLEVQISWMQSLASQEKFPIDLPVLSPSPISSRSFCPL